MRERLASAIASRQVLRGTTSDVVAEDLVELDAAGMVGRDDRRAGGERLDRDGRQGLEQRRQHEDVGDGRVARDVVVGARGR